MRSSGWSGTGTVIVVGPCLFCMMTWLPRLLISLKLWAARMAQTCRPERTRSLPKRDLDLRHVELALESRFDLFGRGTVEKQVQCFP